MSEPIDINGSVSEALEALQGQSGRDPVTGQFVAGNTAAGTTLARSEALWTALAPARDAIVVRVMTDRGDKDDAVETIVGLCGAYAEARLLRESLFIRMAELGGPITPKGKARALYAAYLSALDREHRLAATLGLERQAKHVDLARTFAEQDR